MQWCCDGLDRLLKKAGEKGFSIVAKKDPEVDFRGFFLQGCPFEKDIVEFLSKVDPDTGKSGWPDVRDKDGRVVPLVTSIKLLLTCCPRCGAQLEKVIEANLAAFDELAAKHSSYF